MSSSDEGGEGADSTTESSTKRGSKVGRMIEKYELNDLGMTLQEYWTRETDPYSLRDLAEFFNHQILRTAMEHADMTILDGEVENTYRLLTSDEVSSGMRKQAENSLSRNGIEVEELTSDFVSHQAVHTYLRKYRGVSLDENKPETDQVEKTAETIQRLRSRVTAVTERNLTNLRDTGRLDVCELNVFVDIRVLCEECGSQFSLDDLLADRKCHCEISAD